MLKNKRKNRNSKPGRFIYRALRRRTLRRMDFKLKYSSPSRTFSAANAVRATSARRATVVHQSTSPTKRPIFDQIYHLQFSHILKLRKTQSKNRSWDVWGLDQSPARRHEPSWPHGFQAPARNKMAVHPSYDHYVPLSTRQILACSHRFRLELEFS